ncbi:DNA-binding IclR family transcriptional regulator [Paraburkholderia sp. WC7.3g]|uniref:IclR family transcriptional regulator n=1 Tax=Paraburkholderia podalyriae TaxID=1938811 RepID=A0ABR7PI63_9BURK|nr:IclR family transcriptional regulator [Paraburkholderia podalyriae]MBC8746006.1 IclR family transcriptional regulator [Paraburkholderia podalyriae]
MTTTDAQRNITLTVERGLEVLCAFRAARSPLSNAELVRRTGLPKATVSRLTTTLISVGYLRRVGGGRQFELSAGALSIGHAYLEANPMTRIVNPVMQKLADKLDLSVALAIPHHLDMLYIGWRASGKIATLRLGVGSLLPIETTAVGRAYLYALPQAEREPLIAELLEAAGDHADVVRKNLDTAFDDLRESGVCMAVGEYQRNAYGIALPLVIGRSHTLMTLNCGAVELVPDMMAIRKRVIPELKSAAVRLTELLVDVDCEP